MHIGYAETKEEAEKMLEEFKQEDNPQYAFRAKFHDIDPNFGIKP